MSNKGAVIATKIALGVLLLVSMISLIAVYSEAAFAQTPDCTIETHTRCRNNETSQGGSDGLDWNSRLPVGINDKHCWTDECVVNNNCIDHGIVGSNANAGQYKGSSWVCGQLVGGPPGYRTYALGGFYACGPGKADQTLRTNVNGDPGPSYCCHYSGGNYYFTNGACAERCNDGIDNDADIGLPGGGIDFEDSDCIAPSCNGDYNYDYSTGITCKSPVSHIPINVPPGNYEIKTIAWRGNPGQTQTDEVYYLETQYTTGPLSPDDADQGAITIRLDIHGNFIIGPDTAEITMKRPPACGDPTANSVDITRLCLFERPVCGDGVQQGGEECDDGNNADGDGCSATCTVEYCGDGIVQPLLGEECDDGEENNGVVCTPPYDGSCQWCSSECTIETEQGPRCGDGVLQSEYEECDDGNTLPGDGCDAQCMEEITCNRYADCPQPGNRCMYSFCKNPGTTDSECVYAHRPLGYNCQDDGDICTDDYCNGYGACIHPNNDLCYICGDGVLDQGEECDDGNTVSGDGCSAQCIIEECGDGITQTGLGEECDDGNLINEDGCNEFCEEEYCDDGTTQEGMGEECDEGSNNGVVCTPPYDGACDWCSSECTIETEVGGSCGDGVIQPTYEECDDGSLNGIECFPPYGSSCEWCDLDCTSVTSPGPFCGDGTRQPDYEECDGTDGVGPGQVCSDTCELVNLCPTDATVRVDFIRVVNTGNGNSQAKTFVGMVPEEYNDGETIPLTDGSSNFIVDGGLIQDVPGLSMERGEEFLHFILKGDQTNSDLEDVEFFVTFEGALITDFANDPFDPIEAGDTLLPNIGTRQAQANMKVAPASDGFFLNYTCEETDEFCGDDILDPALGEECDDGNNVDGDGCSAQCLEEICGNGRLDYGEECDDGNTFDEDGCSAVCVIEYCGDGIVQVGSDCDADDCDLLPGLQEQCDDGNTINGDGCNEFCELEFCGDGTVNNGDTEECDDGNEINGDGCSTLCTIEFCGDGIVQNGTEECLLFPDIDACQGPLLEEECDDGNDVSGDGCSDQCVVEFCGDGIIQTGLDEDCDDGNTIPGDGCSATCEVEIASINIIKTAGDTADGETLYILENTMVEFRYTITNTGQVDLFDGTLDDDILGHVGTFSFLAKGDSIVLTKNSAVLNSQTNIGLVEAHPMPAATLPMSVSDADDAAVVVVDPSINMEKLAGDAPDGTVYYTTAGPVTYTYIIRNIGDVHLTSINVTDDNGTPTNTADDMFFDGANTPELNNLVLAPGAEINFTKLVNVENDKINVAEDYGTPSFPDGTPIPNIPAVTGTDDAEVVIEFCGDGITQQHNGEECDLGGGNGNVCTPPYGGSCEWCSSICEIETEEGPYCGDGTTDSPNEECDDGQNNGNICDPPYDGLCQWCDISCNLQTEEGPYCGDDIVNGEEECDDGVNNGLECTPPYGGSCMYCSEICEEITLDGPRCGDGTIDEPYEECDDGNTANGDGCSATCEVEICEHDVGIRYSYSNGIGTGIAIRPDSGAWILDDPAELVQNDTYNIKYFIDNKIEDTTNFIDVLVKIGDTVISEYNTSINNFHFKVLDFNTANIATGEYNISVRVDKVNEIDCNLTDNYAERRVLITAECGDGILQEGEECDDGNTANGDGCSATCEIEQCEDITVPETIKTYGEPFYTDGTAEWINNLTTITLNATDEIICEELTTFYRVTLVDDANCRDLEACLGLDGDGNFIRYTGPFTIDEESCHLIEFYSTDGYNTEDKKQQCAFVDSTPPEGNKTIRDPKEVWEGDNTFYTNLTEKCWGEGEDALECWKVTLFTPIEISCTDPEPHPVDNPELCFNVELDGEDATEDYCDTYSGVMDGSYCCLLQEQDPLEFYFTEESQHNLKFYCKDGLGNRGPIDDEKFKVEGRDFRIQLNKKWNLISVPFVLLNGTMEEVFEDIAEDVDSVWTYDAAAGEWHIFTPDGVANDDLNTLIPGWGYWILANNDTTLHIGGSLFSPVTVPPSKNLTAGWNLIGYYGNENILGNQIFAYDGPDGDGKVATCALGSLVDTTIGYPRWHSLITYWELFNVQPDPNPWIELSFGDNMDPGAGYWIFVDEDDIYGPFTSCPVA